MPTWHLQEEEEEEDDKLRPCWKKKKITSFGQDLFLSVQAIVSEYAFKKVCVMPPYTFGTV